MIRRLVLCLLLISCWNPVPASAPDSPVPVKRTPGYSQKGTEGCLRCHSGEKMRAVTNSAHGDLKGPPDSLASRGCEACHGPGSIHVSRAHGGAGFPRLIDFGRGAGSSPREMQIQACLACHGNDNAVGATIGWNGGPHDRGPINCSTCHTIHVVADPMNDREEQVARCIGCHRRDVKDHRRFEKSSIDFDSMACGSCHDVHEQIIRGEQDASEEA